MDKLSRDHLNDWNTLILRAQREGYTTVQDEEGGLWYVVTPARPRRPSQELGSYKTQRDAWKGAALLSHLDADESQSQEQY